MIELPKIGVVISILVELVYCAMPLVRAAARDQLYLSS